MNGRKSLAKTNRSYSTMSPVSFKSYLEKGQKVPNFRPVLHFVVIATSICRKIKATSDMFDHILRKFFNEFAF